MAPSLGRLEKVNVRDIWESEAQDFTPWLAQPENLSVLADTLNMDLEIEAQEKNVGPFRADILCKDLTDGTWVLIENQLEKTDHSHLGQLLTYASGLQAVTIVWVSTKFTEEHRAALDWLNDITDEKFRFFGLEVELWRIGDSPAAPKFNVVSQPNEWSKSVSDAAKRIDTEELSEIKLLQLQFWTEFRERLIGHPNLRAKKALPQHWMLFSIGRSGFQLSATINSRDSRLGVELYLSDEYAKAYFWLLMKEKSQIEREIGLPLEWMELPSNRRCRIVHFRSVTDTLDESKWPEYQSWMIATLEKFYSAFSNRIKNLDADEYTGEPQGSE